MNFKHFELDRETITKLDGQIFNCIKDGEPNIDYFVEVIRANDDYTVINYYHACELSFIKVLNKASEQDIAEVVDVEIYNKFLGK